VPVPTLTPAFQDFLPGWIARQPWFRGPGLPALRPVGFYRAEDPAGQVGIETHLVTDGTAVYQIPMTYRGAPLARTAGGRAADPAALLAEAEHSELGARWIYDAVHDPVWIAAMIRLVAAEGTARTRSNQVVGPVTARGVLYRAWPDEIVPAIELIRVLGGGPDVAAAPGVLGTVRGSWFGAGPDGPMAEGCLAVLRDPPATG
jgi:hypothetical protein